MLTHDFHEQQKLKDGRERFHLWLFSTLYQLPGEELPRQDAGQKPDFRYRVSQWITGIEHTEIKSKKSVHEKTSLAELKGIQRQIVRQAKQLATKQGIPPIDVEVWFHDYFYRYPNKGEKAVHALLTSITANLDKILETEHGGGSVEIEVPKPFVGISMIYAKSGKINGNVWLKDHRWKTIEPSWVMRGFLSELQDTISAKNQKIGNCLKNCNECWLLIVADRSKADQSYYLTPEMTDHMFTSKFKKTFFLEIAERFLLELKTI